jgi:hypothetical protein
VRVNLIRSILVFQEKKYCLHDNVKLVFFKKYTQKLYTLKKKITRTVQVNLHCLRAQCKWIALCTRIQNLKKQPGAASRMSRLKRELAWVPPVIFSVFDITKRLAPAFWLKRNLYRVNKRSLYLACIWREHHDRISMLLLELWFLGTGLSGLYSIH